MFSSLHRCNMWEQINFNTGNFMDVKVHPKMRSNKVKQTKINRKMEDVKCVNLAFVCLCRYVSLDFFSFFLFIFHFSIWLGIRQAIWKYMLSIWGHSGIQQKKWQSFWISNTQTDKQKWMDRWMVSRWYIHCPKW